jgi:hypothetical protein
MLALKKLHIVSLRQEEPPRVRHLLEETWPRGYIFGYDHGATPFIPLLDIASGVKLVEEIMLSDLARPKWMSRESLPWARAFKIYSGLAAKLVEIDGATEDDVPSWAELELASVRKVRLWARSASIPNWTRYDAFPNLRELSFDNGEERVGSYILLAVAQSERNASETLQTEPFGE